MKLQKLLYYEQGYHLAYYGTPLFDEEIEAWKFGPVVPQIYEKYKIYENKPIMPADGDVSISGEPYDLFYGIFTYFNKYSAFGLMEKTHSEDPWVITSRNGVGPSHVIPKQLILEFFRKIL